MSDWICYPNGPFYDFKRWIFELLKFWKWKKMKKSWIYYSIRRFLGMKSDYEEFQYFLHKYKDKKSWFEINNLKLEKKYDKSKSN